jgi:hypothetical protein
MPDSWCPAISADAITSAAGAIWDVHTNGPVPVDKGQWCNLLARAALEAVAPVIAAAERERIAAWLRRAAAGRREYASRGPDDHEVKPMLELAASCCESAAQLITDPAHMLDVIPAWRWTEAEIADLHGGNGTG